MSKNSPQQILHVTVLSKESEYFFHHCSSLSPIITGPSSIQEEFLLSQTVHVEVWFDERKFLAWFPQNTDFQGLKQHIPGFSSGLSQMPPPSPVALQDIATCNIATTPTSASKLHLNNTTYIWSIKSEARETMKYQTYSLLQALQSAFDRWTVTL